jgi:uncharacterized membrane protein YjjP (DUF1212 family)
MSQVSNNEIAVAPSLASLTSILDVLLRLGALLLRSGDTAFRVRQSMQRCANSLGLTSVSIQINLNAIHLCGSLGGERITLVKEVGTPGVNAERLSRLEKLIRSLSNDMSQHGLATGLDAIEQEPPIYSILQTSLAVGAACGAFAVLNGGIGIEMLAAMLGGGVGQGVRSWLTRRRINQYATTAICAILASGIYCLLAILFIHIGIGVPRHTIGFISSVLFLIPGFPLIAALLDLLQHEATASVTRLAYASMLLLSASLGLSAVIEMLGFTSETPPSHELSWPLLLALRILASFVAGSGFAILFNCSLASAFQVGLLSIVGNLVRLTLRDADLGLPLATFVGSFAVGLTASMANRWIDKPRMTLTVPAVIMMVPGLYAFDALVLFNHGEITGALRSLVLFAFGVGAMAMGLAAARFITEPEWLKE